MKDEVLKRTEENQRQKRGKIDFAEGRGTIKAKSEVRDTRAMREGKREKK